MKRIYGFFFCCCCFFLSLLPHYSYFDFFFQALCVPWIHVFWLKYRILFWKKQQNNEKKTWKNFSQFFLWLKYTFLSMENDNYGWVQGFEKKKKVLIISSVCSVFFLLQTTFFNHYYHHHGNDIENRIDNFFFFLKKI